MVTGNSHSKELQRKYDIKENVPVKIKVQVNGLETSFWRFTVLFQNIQTFSLILRSNLAQC